MIKAPLREVIVKCTFHGIAWSLCIIITVPQLDRLPTPTLLSMQCTPISKASVYLFAHAELLNLDFTWVEASLLLSRAK